MFFQNVEDVFRFANVRGGYSSFSSEFSKELDLEANKIYKHQLMGILEMASWRM